jgi:hypothetical protein
VSGLVLSPQKKMSMQARSDNPERKYNGRHVTTDRRYYDPTSSDDWNNGNSDSTVPYELN